MYACLSELATVPSLIGTPMVCVLVCVYVRVYVRDGHSAIVNMVHLWCVCVRVHMYMCVRENMHNINDMGWLRSEGSIKIQVSFAEYRLFYKALLPKRPIIFSSLLTEATP